MNLLNFVPVKLEVDRKITLSYLVYIVLTTEQEIFVNQFPPTR